MNTKSVKAGPFRVTASKSGISYIAGAKGARVTKRANGKVQTTLSAPGTGLRYTTTSSTRKRQAKRPAASTPPSARLPVTGRRAELGIRSQGSTHAEASATARPAVHHTSPDCSRAAAALHHQRLPCRRHHPRRRHPYRAGALRQDQRQPLSRHLLARASGHRLPGAELLPQRSCPLRHLRRPARPDIHRQRQPHGRKRPEPARHPVRLAPIPCLQATPRLAHRRQPVPPPPHQPPPPTWQPSGWPPPSARGRGR